MDVVNLLAGNPGFVVVNGIPRQKSVYTGTQTHTMDSFGFKWRRKEIYDSPPMLRESARWLAERYSMPGWSAKEAIKGKRVLDAGCGSGYSALLLFDEALNEAEYVGVDISTAVEDASRWFDEKGRKGQFVQASAMDMPDELGAFDVIFSEGVLRHTDSTEKAVKYLAGKLNDDGLFMFYVYAKKGPIREFADDYIRGRLACMDGHEAWDSLMPLTKPGKTLGELNQKIKIEEPIDILDIPAGEIDLQRLFYWHVMKLFYHEDYTLDQMNLVNFDWYHPANCHRQTPEEVKRWLNDAGLDLASMNVQPSGMTVIAVKRGRGLTARSLLCRWI